MQIIVDDSTPSVTLPNSNSSNKMSTGSLIDHISALLQQRALAQNGSADLKLEPISFLGSNDITTCNNSSTQSPDSESSTSSENNPTAAKSRKRSASPLHCETDFKKVKEEIDSDTESSEHGTSDDLNITTMSPNMNMLIMTKPKHLITPDDVFMSVPGRLSLLTSTNRYKVTVGEIQRRLGHPENLNASILGAILRRAKSKNGGKELRAILEHNGMILPIGRRKSTQITLFTSLIEGEAEHFAKDFDFVCNNEFPARELAEHMVLSHKQEPENIKKRKDELLTALKVMNELLSLMSENSSKSIQKPLENFQLLTHNFGAPALLTAYGTFNKYITTQLDILRETEMKCNNITVQQLVNRALPNNIFNQSNEITLQTLLQMCQQKKYI